MPSVVNVVERVVLYAIVVGNVQLMILENVINVIWDGQ